MRVRLSDGRTALCTYCANVHPGERADDVIRALDAAAEVRRALGVDRLGLGLWLSRPALDELGAAAELGPELERRGLEVFTLNGFPYGDFHADVVKRAVYHPDWSAQPRLDYTIALAEILARLLPPDLDAGTISTLPLAHRDEPGADLGRSLDQVCRLCQGLARIADRTGKRIRVCFEPEPGCLLETTADAVRFWTDDLPAAARRTGVPHDLVAAHAGLCFDTCHQAVAFEEAAHSLDALAAAGVPVGKVQLSSALVVPAPGSPAGRAALSRFAEPRFLHQVRARSTSSGSIGRADDLDRTAGLDPDAPWRIHFHVPIHRAAVAEVATTRDFLLDALRWLRAPGRPLPHLEVETYTWSVLPPAERPRDVASLCAGIAAELAWVREELRAP